MKTGAAKTRRQFLAAGGAGLVAGAAAVAGRPAGALAPLNVAGIYSVPVAQRWISTIHRALLNSVIRGDISYEYRDNVSRDNYESVFRQFSERGSDLVIGDAFAYEQVARFLSDDYPGTPYLMGSIYKSDSRFSNFAVFDNYIQDASYLSGLIAGGLSTNGVLGIIARYRFPGINRLINAYMDGAREVRSDIQFLIDFIESWYDLGKAQDIARAQIAGGADVIYADALGPEEIARQSSVPVIGTMSDIYFEGRNSVVTSALWHFEPTIAVAIERLRTGSFSAADYGIYSHMGHAGCSLAPIRAFSDKISEESMDLVAWRENQFRSFKFAARIDDSDPALRLNVKSGDTDEL